MSVLYRNPNRWTDCNEIWHRCIPQGQEGSWGVIPIPLGTGCEKGVRGASGASTVNFGKNFIKQKLQSPPDLMGVGNLFGPKSGSGRPWAPCSSRTMVTHMEG